MKCGRCSADIAPGQRVCLQCGAILEADPSSTVAIRFDLLRAKRARSNQPEAADPAPEQSLILQIRGLQRKLSLHHVQNLVVGRADPGSGFYPDFDLGPFGAEQRGVSRQHLMLNYANGILTVTDLDSANGTRLNGQALQALRPYPVNDGDELILGQLAIGVRYGT
ncbi:MAG: FHA domain-containing protein [Anaerolineae bacterium]|nr:FHA domain-containing protein [Anaerolineae bacterium]